MNGRAKVGLVDRARLALAAFVFGVTAAVSKVIGDAAYGTLKAAHVTPEMIDGALTTWQGGNCSQIGDIFDLMLSHPFISGVRGQLRSAVSAIVASSEIQAADESPEAELIADEWRAVWAALDTPIVVVTDEGTKTTSTRGMFIEGLFDHWARGGGLTEPVWRLNGKRWELAGFREAAQSRIRWTRDTREIAYAPTPHALQGIPASAYPFGTWVAITPSENITDFAKRGLDRSVLTDWFATLNSSGWWSQDLENYGSPILWGKAKADTPAFTSLTKAFSEMGANARLITDPAAEITPIQKSVNVVSPHGKFEESRERRISIAYLGASQTVQIEANAGSIQSATVHQEVRNEKAQEIATYLRAQIQAQLCAAWVALNHGIEKLHLTPKHVGRKQLEDAMAVLAELKEAKAIGIPVVTQEVYDRLGWTRPEGVPDTLFLPTQQTQADPVPEQAPAPLKKAA